MPVAKLIAPTTKQEIPKLRVAAYCRVSSNSADQRNSFATQEHVYTKYIAKKQEWELVDIFADEGLSGMKADNRPEFQRMIRMCELHQIDLILTKSVSRFARNVKEALSYTRKLKLLGVGVQFEEDGVNTLAMADEMLLNTFAAIAQEESKSISQNQRLSIVKRMEAGEYIASNAPYGYRLIDKKLVIYEPEAEVVRWIFAAYLNGMSTVEIAHELSAKSVLTKGKKEQWKANRIAYILSNEKYDGDTLFQKYYGEETVPFKKHRNYGEMDQFFAYNTHDAILPQGMFQAAQTLLQSRGRKFGRKMSQSEYPLTSRIRCSECGAFYHLHLPELQHDLRLSRQRRDDALQRHAGERREARAARPAAYRLRRPVSGGHDGYHPHLRARPGDGRAEETFHRRSVQHAESGERQVFAGHDGHRSGYPRARPDLGYGHRLSLRHGARRELPDERARGTQQLPLA